MNSAAASSPSGTPPKLNLLFLEDSDGLMSNPPGDLVTRWIRDLRCLLVGHGPCAAGCRDTLPALTSAGFLTPAAGTDGPPNVHFTADLVWALAHAQHRGERIDWRKLEEIIARLCNTQLPDLSLQHLRDSTKEAFERLARHRPQFRPSGSLDSQDGALEYPHDQNDEVESPAPSLHIPANNGFGAEENRPHVGGQDPTGAHNAPHTGENAAVIPALSLMIEKMTEVLRQQSAQTAEQTSAALNRITEISSQDRASMFAAAAQTEHIISTSVRFTGDTKAGTTEYAIFRSNFIRRAEKLRWSDRDKCQNWCQAWEDKALRVLQAKMQSTRGEASRMFEDDWETLLRWSDEQYTLAGANYHINFKSLLEQRSKETYTDYTNRITATLTTFLDNHKAYLLDQMMVQHRFLEKGLEPAKLGEVAWTEADDEKINQRYAALPGPGRPSPDLLRRWLIEDRNTQPPGARETTWGQITITLLWTAICFPVMDGMRSTAARRDAYRKRDECYTKADLRTKAGQSAIDALKLFVASKEAEADNLQTINNKHLAKINAARGDGDVQIDKVNGQQRRQKKNGNNGNRRHRSASRNGRGGRSNSKGRRGRVNGIDGGEERYDEEPTHTHTGTRPPRGEVGATRGMRGGARGRTPRRTMPNGGDIPQEGAVYYGPDGLRRTFGAICGKCGARNHTSEDCAKGVSAPNMGAVSADRDGTRGRTLAQVFAENP